uniref:GK21801 n=1 Tax=Drosophila willistoni TaxID=7260 RepID=B4MPZ6_DROWI
MLSEHNRLRKLHGSPDLQLVEVKQFDKIGAAAKIPGVFASVEEDILNEHNRLRKLHGSPDLQLVDVKELNLMSETAKAIAKSGENVPYERSTGEIFCKTLEKPVKCVQQWYDEIKDYDFNKPGFSDKTKCFTALIWKASTSLRIPGVFASVEEDILNEHNRLRKLHGSPDLQLADVKALNVMSIIVKAIAYSGQVLTYERSSGDIFCKTLEKPVKCVQQWYDEIKDYDFNKPGFSNKTKCFTALIWKASTTLSVGTAYK